MTDDDALAFARIIDEANENHVALVGLMKAIARYGRPSSLPDDGARGHGTTASVSLAKQPYRSC